MGAALDNSRTVDNSHKREEARMMKSREDQKKHYMLISRFIGYRYKMLLTD